ncbi:MAG: MMPL family transporter [Polyangiaceae bacterium]|nr:MMPL family transporter [Polyangiaceae bacterium]
MHESEKRLPRFLHALGLLQFRRPWLLIAVALVSLVPAAWAASGLTYKEDFAELLPDNKPSVIEARRVSQHLAGDRTLTVVATTKTRNDKALQGFVDALVPHLTALGPDWVGRVDSGVSATKQFFEDNKLLYAKTEDLQKAHDEILERYDYEVAKAQGQLLDDSDPPPPITAKSIKRRLRGEKDAAGNEQRHDDAPAGKDAPPGKDAPADKYPNGYYQNQDGTLIAVLVRTSVSGTKRTEELKARVAEAVAATHPERFAPDLEVHYTGGVITGAEEYNAIIRDLSEVGAAGVIGVLLSVFLFFLRVRVVFTMGATLLVGLLWTFGLTRFTIGYLNSATGFLVSIIAGNGINYAIMYMARYIEARRDDGLGVQDAILRAHRDSWIPTLASSATAMLAYGSLALTDFRGFKHFGVIGGYGMILCWIVTYLFTPAILAASERVVPSFKGEGKQATKQRGYYGVVFEKLAYAAPRTLVAAGAAMTLASLALSVQYFRADPMEYDMRNVRNERTTKTSAGVLSQRVDEVVGRLGQDGLAILADRVDQVPLLEAELERRRAAAPKDAKPFEKVVTIYSLLPTDQAKKATLINEIRDRILRAKRRDWISAKDWAELEPNLPKDAVKPLGIVDLPEQVARSFTEKDGTRGRIVYIVPAEHESVWDAKYLIRWAASFRTTKLPSGEIIQGSGQSVIFADMIQTIGEDAPKAIVACSLGSILIILVAFRGHVHSLGVFVPWLIGIAGLVAFLQLKGIKLNFLNFVALPITIGIGAEYAHNLMQRYRVEGPENLHRVITETGGAVVLCSLTTAIGYLALLLSINRGIVSFGLAAAAGEVTCVVAAVLLLPAFLVWRAGATRPPER